MNLIGMTLIFLRSLGGLIDEERIGTKNTGLRKGTTLFIFLKGRLAELYLMLLKKGLLFVQMYAQIVIEKPRLTPTTQTIGDL